jgi:hypothetical protein
VLRIRIVDGTIVNEPGKNADRLYEFHRANGAEIAQAIDDRPYGIRDYTVRDLYGYYLVFGHHLFNAGPLLKIERVDVPVRLETRLAALLRDLAQHKRMSETPVSRRCCCTLMRASGRIRKRPYTTSKS